MISAPSILVLRAAAYAQTRSRLDPRTLGVLMIMAGGCYLASSLAAFLDPVLSSRMIP